SGAARREAEDGLRQAHHVAGAWARRLHNLLPRGKIADAPDLGPPGYPAGQVLGAYGADLHLLQLLEERGRGIRHPADDAMVGAGEDVVEVSVPLHDAPQLPVDPRPAQGADLLELVEADRPYLVVLRRP